MSGKDFCPIVNNCVLAAGIACILYYIGCGLFVRFGQSLLWIWPVAGVILIARYFLARAGIIAMIPRGLLITARTCIALAAAFFLLVQGVIVSAMVTSPPSGLDYIVVLGARVNGTEPSPALRMRSEVAAEYLLANPDTIAIATGGMGEGEGMTEAECIASILMEAGVAPERILLENEATSTAENMRFSYAMMDDPDATVGIVTNGYHMYRAKLIARSSGGHPTYGVSAGSSLFMLPHTMTREFIGLVVGALRGDFSLSAL